MARKSEAAKAKFRAYMKTYREVNKDRVASRKHAYNTSPHGRAMNRASWLRMKSSPEKYEPYRLKRAEEYRESRRVLISMYGGKCTCCGEVRFEFLSIDHVNGGGVKHRKEFGNHTTYHRWLLKEKREGFQVLCHNCNASYGYYGYCPHMGAPCQ